MKYHLYDRGQFIGFFTLFWVLVCLLLISLTNVSSGGGSWAWPMIMLISLLSAIPLPLNMANCVDGQKSKAQKIKDEAFFMAFWFLSTLIGIMGYMIEVEELEPSGLVVTISSFTMLVIYFIFWIIRLRRAGSGLKVKRNKREGKDQEVLYRKSTQKEETPR